MKCTVCKRTIGRIGPTARCVYRTADGNIACYRHAAIEERYRHHTDPDAYYLHVSPATLGEQACILQQLGRSLDEIAHIAGCSKKWLSVLMARDRKARAEA